MKIIFAVNDNKGWESIISSRFGRANGFLLYDESSDELSYHSNSSNVNAGHGAGIQASQSVIDLGTDIVITGGDFGPKALQMLKSANIKMHEHAGEISVKKAYENFKKK